MNEKMFIVTDMKYHIIKVGRSKNPYKNLKTIQKNDSNVLEIVCVFKEDIEKDIKELLKEYKIRGDWYYPNPKILLKIQEKYLPNNRVLATFINDLFGELKIDNQPICLCWVDDDESRCQFKRHKTSLITCESYEIWKACVRKEEKEIDFGD
ncbi:MAG: GIY-YIG nuclease family protein [Candidatus Lokiarchaeota archaeon]|nr:GIY-YIG nuclease family protein [Candidatus Lokiarchaeota archaeon]